jgi:Trm5-related predicted tRNA methylase
MNIAPIISLLPRPKATRRAARQRRGRWNMVSIVAKLLATCRRYLSPTALVYVHIDPDTRQPLAVMRTASNSTKEHSGSSSSAKFSMTRRSAL